MGDLLIECAEGVVKYHNPLWGVACDEVMNEWSITRAVQHSAKQTVHFHDGTKTFTVDTKTQVPPDLEVEPEVCHEFPLPFVAIAHDIESCEELYSIIFTKEKGWLKTSLKNGNDVICEIESADM